MIPPKTVPSSIAYPNLATLWSVLGLIPLILGNVWIYKQIQMAGSPGGEGGLIVVVFMFKAALFSAAGIIFGIAAIYSNNRSKIKSNTNFVSGRLLIALSFLTPLYTFSHHPPAPRYQFYYQLPLAFYMHNFSFLILTTKESPIDSDDAGKLFFQYELDHALQKFFQNRNFKIINMNDYQNISDEDKRRTIIAVCKAYDRSTPKYSFIFFGDSTNMKKGLLMQFTLPGEMKSKREKMEGSQNIIMGLEKAFENEEVKK